MSKILPCPSFAALSFLLLLTTTPALADDSPSGIWPASEAPEISDPTSQRILDLHLKARGGADRLRNLHTLVFQGQLKEGRDEFQLTQYHAAPLSLRTETRRDHLGWQYLTATVATPDSAWSRELLPNPRKPQSLSDSQHRQLLLEAALPFLFLDHQKKGHRFRYKGKVRFAGKEAYLLHGYLAFGLRIEVHFDAQSFHVLNYRHPFPVANKQILVNRLPVGLRKMDGLWFETGYDFRHKGSSLRHLSFSEIYPNRALPSSSFQRPHRSSIHLGPQ